MSFRAVVGKQLWYGQSGTCLRGKTYCDLDGSHGSNSKRLHTHPKGNVNIWFHLHNIWDERILEMNIWVVAWSYREGIGEGELSLVTKGQHRDLGGFEGLFSTLTMVTDSWIYAGDRIDRTEYTHIYIQEWIHVKLGNLNISELYQVNICLWY